MKTSSRSLNPLTVFFVAFMVLLLGSARVAAEVPVVTSDLELVAEFGVPFKYEVTATNNALGYSFVNLPYWLERKENVLVGTPIKKGQYTIKIYALNSFGVSKAYLLSLSVK